MEIDRSRFIFDEKFSYPFLSILRQFEGKFDQETKKWSVPLKHKSNFNQAVHKEKQRQKERLESNWKQACADVGVQFCKKGSPEYDDVMVVFKELMKSQSD